MTRDWDERAGDLSAEAIAAGEPTAWFDRLYAEGTAGIVSMPWDRDAPQVELGHWWRERGAALAPGRAVVVGCGLGADAELLAASGHRTTAFDIAPTAVAEARRRHPDTAVDYRVADLLDLPDDLVGAFELVLEIFTLQALPDPPRAQAAAGVASLLAPGATLLVIAFRHDSADPPTGGPPYPLTHDDLDLLTRHGLETISVEELDGPRWRVELRRP